MPKNKSWKTRVVPRVCYSRLAMTLWAVCLVSVVPGSAAEPCIADEDCDDGILCNGRESCSFRNECQPGRPACSNLSLLEGVAVTASSIFSAGFAAELAIDGVNTSNSSWCTAINDPAPGLSLVFPADVDVASIRVATSWSPTYDFTMGQFTILDAADGVLFDSGAVAFTNGEISLDVSPPALGARKVEFGGITWNSIEPCLSELEVLGPQQVTCATDDECSDGKVCNGLETCDDGGLCQSGSQRCEKLTGEATVAASSDFGPGWEAEQAVDGINAQGSSWCTALDDSAPMFTARFPQERDIARIRILTSWSPGFDFLTGAFTFLDSEGVEQLASGAVDFLAGEIELELELFGAVPAAREIVFAGLTWNSNEPCFSEFEVYGPFCGIFLQAGEPDLLHFKPDLPTPDFEVRWGSLGDVRTGKGFSTAECLGRFTAGPAELLIPDPPPGEGLYFLSRGTNMCLQQGWGYAKSDPDLRAELDLLPDCP